MRPADLGAAAAAGHDSLEVARKPRVAILPTGTELVPLGSKLRPGDILEYNSLVLAAQVKSMGGEPVRFPITEDNFESICARVGEVSRDYDLILLNAGSSAGTEDFSARVVEHLGELLVHGVAVRPGHPVILGMIRRAGSAGPAQPQGGLEQAPESVPVIGVPGYPVSAALTADIFVEPLLARWLGRRPAEPPAASAILTRKIVSPAGDDDYVRVTLGRVGPRLLAAPLPRGAGIISSLSRADGLLVFPRGRQGMDAGQEVTVRLLRSAPDLERTIFCIGSHDVILDLLAQYLSERGRRLVSVNVGSQAGLVALRRGEAHLAGSHLLDPETGQYNVRYVREYLPHMAVRLVVLVRRQQGLMIQRGNRKGLMSLRDLARPEVSFINRQRGAGTRVLLDYHLNVLGIPPGEISGYDQEEYTHLGVAAAVASGRADCGLGIAAAAQALDLDFVPLFQERYDLVIPRDHAVSEHLAPLFQVLADPQFRREVAGLPGYDTSVMGEVIQED